MFILGWNLSEELCREVLHRQTNNKMIVDLIHNFHQVGMAVGVNHILGIPGDSIALQEKSILFYNEHRPDRVHIFWMTYYPKTPIVNIALKRGAITPQDVEIMEQGFRINPRYTSCLHGGSIKDKKGYFAVVFMLSYMPFLPSLLVKKLVATGLYRLFDIRNFFIVNALPRVLQDIFMRKNISGKSIAKHFLREVLKILR